MIKRNYGFIAFLAATLILFIACNDESSPMDPSDAVNDIILSTTLGSSSFISTIPGLSQENVDNTEAIETTFYAYLFVHEDWLFTCPNLSGDIVEKYNIDEDGNLTLSGSMVTNQASYPSDILVINDTKAYLTLHYAGQIVEFNPTTMEQTAVIDLSGPDYAVEDNNPDPTNLLLRGNTLFVGLAQSPDGVTGHPGVHLLTIDITSNTVQDYIIDERGGSYCGRTGDQSFFFMDENENIYVSFVGSWGFVPGQRAGFLRINAGTTEFDPNYILYLDELTIANVDGGINYFNQIQYAGNNTVYGIANVPALASNPPDFINDRPGAIIKVDLVAKSAERIMFPYSKLLADVALYDNKLLAALSTTTGIGIYTYDLSTGETSQSPLVNIQGDPLFLSPMNR